MNDGRAKVWRHQGELYADCCVGSDHVGRQEGDSVGWYIVALRDTPLVVIEGNPDLIHQDLQHIFLDKPMCRYYLSQNSLLI